MEKLKEVEWIWDKGKVTSKLLFENGEIQIRKNDEIPPTRPSHDIAHFICGFNGNLEWDYEKEPNHIAEYNAVFLENILHSFSSSYYREDSIDILSTKKSIDDYMVWFSKDYYKIEETHPDKKTSLELKKDFLDSIDFTNVCDHFLSYYRVWILEELLPSQDINIIINMETSIDYSFNPLYNFLTTLREELYE